MNKIKSPVPIIDLFAGPGGLGEGFSALKTNGKPVFRIGISVEKDPVAHRTLTLRSVFRQLQSTPVERHYYDYIKGELSEKQFKAIPAVAQAYDHASTEARCLELGKTDASALDKVIRTALGEADQWVLIGGPPCQAYSLAGRSRRARDATFQQDEKHFLYREYLRIIQEHQPTVFVMENVKGLLSSKHSGNPMFAKIIHDLSEPRAGLQYDIRSFVVPGRGDSLEPSDYVIESELYGIPQCRHRVILLGVRKDLPEVKHKLLKRAAAPTSVHRAIGNLPKIRSRLSKADSTAGWHEALIKAPDMVRGWDTENEKALIDSMTEAAVRASSITDAGAKFLRSRGSKVEPSDLFFRWISDDQLHGVCQHDARSHMPSDLARYLFAASFAKISGYSPRLGTFPPKLLPKHKSAKKRDGKAMPFQDRFRVQCRHEPATTIMSHIAKDGHYYIHYDPEQCRSLTVREAARLQTFPDNYFFEGTRTEQYTQVGNAVPPLLAFQLAEVVASLLSQLQNRS